MVTSNKSNVVAITGANGFIGRYLVKALSKQPDLSLRVLVRKSSNNNKWGANVTEIEGDLTKPDTLRDFLLEGCIVINLAYSFDATDDQNITAINNLIDICVNKKIKRLIHCSTAAVYGRTQESIVDESSECNPRTNYGKTKLLIENLLLEASQGIFEYVNIRPTAVYGPEGQALMKLISKLENASWFSNYLRSCLFNTRSLNLVHVNNVVAAIIFLMDLSKNIDGETYIVSEDFEPDNNYKYVENFFIKRLEKGRLMIPAFPVPLVFLSWILRLLGRDSINPKMFYDAEKLRKTGFNYEVSLDSGLTGLCEWYESKKKNNKTGVS